jgi:hypothetical protein
LPFPPAPYTNAGRNIQTWSPCLFPNSNTFFSASRLKMP